MSEQTAMELINHGKQEWIVRREDAVEAKGKGKLITYWLKLNSERISASSIAASSEWDESERSERAPTHIDLTNAEKNVEQQPKTEKATPCPKTFRKKN